VRESHFNTVGGSEFQVRDAAVLNDRLANDVRQNGTHSSRTDDGRVLRALVSSEMCWLRYCGDDVCCVLIAVIASHSVAILPIGRC